MTPNVSRVPLELWGGAECTISRVGGAWTDQSQRSGHNDRADDLDRFAGLGLAALRYPLLWESFAAAEDPAALWRWHDARLARLRELGVRPILGLVHHGSGPATVDLLSPRFVTGLADHAARAAVRYPWVRDWTPVNEPLTTARFAALYGHWYPHRRDEAAFWSALLTEIEATRDAMRAIRETIPDARLIQTEDLGHVASTPGLAPQADYYNERRWASWDLLCGTLTGHHPLAAGIEALGLGERLDACAAEPCPPDVMGLNHYLTSDRFLDHRLDRHPAASHGTCNFGALADVEAVRAGDDPPGLAGAVRACWARYGRRIALTEVHNGCTREEQMRWLVEGWTTATKLRAEGIPIEAVTVWSLLGAFDWNSLLTCSDGHYESGVFDVSGGSPRETALAPLARMLAAGERPRHPVLDRKGWWRGHARADERPDRTRTPPLLIVGATGTLGQAFAGACRLRGIEHVVTARDMLDLGDPASIRGALDTIRPWAVVNCAGWVRVDEAEQRAQACFAANTAGSLALAAECARRDLHYTSFSSDLVFDGRSARAYVEGDRTAPLNVYGASKARADAALLAGEARALVIRTASFFSPYDRHNFAVHLVDALRDGRPFSALDDCVTSPTYVPDLVRATLDLVIDDETGLWHLASDGALTWADFAHALAESLDLPRRHIAPLPLAAMDWPAARPRHAPLASTRGRLMPSLASAIERFAEVVGKEPAA